ADELPVVALENARRLNTGGPCRIEGERELDYKRCHIYERVVGCVARAQRVVKPLRKRSAEGRIRCHLTAPLLRVASSIGRLRMLRRFFAVSGIAPDHAPRPFVALRDERTQLFFRLRQPTRIPLAT